MIKDLEEAIYYCTITEAMGENGNRYDYNKINSNVYLGVNKNLTGKQKT